MTIAPIIGIESGTGGVNRAGLFRIPISGGLQSATSAQGLPRPALAICNLMEQARLAHFCTIMSCMHHQLHLPVTTSSPCSTRQQQLSLLCNGSPNPRNYVASRYQMFIVSCSPHQSARRAEEDVNIDGDNDDDSAVVAAAACVAISDILQESGLSKEDAFQIASNSPHYSQMLIDTVRELDEFSLWNSWFNDRQHILQLQQGQQSQFDVSLSLYQKLKCISMDKADDGKIPFLESIGLTLPSAIHISGLFSSQSLPSLISKVKYVKHVFFSVRDDHQSLIVGNHARQMMLHLSILIDDDLQRTLSFFEKIEARRGGLDMLGSEEASFRLLIQSFPRLLSSPVQPNIQEIVEFLQCIGISEQHVGRVLLLFPPIIFLDIEKDIKPSMQTFQKVGITDKQFGRMVYKYPWIVSKSIQKNYKETFSFLEGQKVPRVSVARAIRTFPLLLGCTSNKFEPMMDQFNELGLKPIELGKIIATSPQLLLRKPEEFLKVSSFLHDLGLDREVIGKILIRCPEIFGANVSKTLLRKIEFLSSMGISKQNIPRVIKKYPELFVSDISRTLVPRINYLLSTGLSRKEVAKMISTFSPILGYSIEEVLRPKLEYLINTMKKPVKDVVDYPRFFSYSLDKKIKPRYIVVRSIDKTCSLREMLGKNDEEFAAEFLDTNVMLDPG